VPERDPLTAGSDAIARRKPVRFRGRRHDLLAAREHRAHHEAPAELDGVLIPTYAVLIFLPEIGHRSHARR
jgi:hypothetical protein